MNAVFDNILTRRSVRSYQQRQISEYDLQVILDAASYAPCAMGTQSWRFTAIHSPAAIEKVNKAIRETLRTIPITESTNPYVAKLIEKAQTDDAEFLYGAPTLVIVSNAKENPNAMADSALAMGTMMLAAHSLGIASCWLNQLPGLAHMPLIQALFSEFGLPTDHTAYGSLALGYAAEPPKQADPRKDVIRVI